MRAFPCQTIELTKRFKDAKAVQNMNKHVPEFHACKCQGNGTKTTTNPRRETTGKAGYDGSMIAGLEGERRVRCAHDGQRIYAKDTIVLARLADNGKSPPLSLSALILHC